MSENPAKDARWHKGAESRLMAERDGWCMVRRPDYIPYTITAQEWYALPTASEGRELSERYRQALQP